MGKVIKKKLNGMSWWMKTSLVLFLTLATTVFMYKGWYKPLPAQAAITQPGAWTVSTAASMQTSLSYTMTGTAGTNRMLVVAVSVAINTVTGVTQTCSATYNGVNMLVVPNTSTGLTSNMLHTYLFYLLETGNTSSFTTGAKALAITQTGGTVSYSAVARAVYAGVDQSATPFTSSSGFATTGTTTAARFSTSAAGSATGPLIINTGDQAIGIISVARSTSTAYRTISSWNLGWAISGTNYTGNTTNGVSTYLETNTTVSTSNSSLHTWSGTLATDRSSISGMSIKAYIPPVVDTLTVGSSTTIATASSDTRPSVLMQRVALTSDTGYGNGEVVLSSITIDDNSATASSYDNAKIWIDTSSSATLPATAVLLATSAVYNGGSITIDLTGAAVADRTVTSAIPKYLYITYGMSPGQGALNATVASRITAVNVVASDISATGLTLATTPFTLTTGVSNAITTCTGCHTGYPNLTDVASRTSGTTGQFPGSHSLTGHRPAAGCMACHVLPTAFNHLDTKVTMAATGVGYSKGASFAVSNAALTGGTCNATLCHGAGSPVWGLTPTANACAQCHGYRSASAWKSLAGATANTDTKVGAHFNHISSVTYKFSSSFTCKVCHSGSIELTSELTTAVGHSDTATPAEVSFSGVATTSGTPTYTAGTVTCASVYCHGSGLASNLSNPPSSASPVATLGATVWNVPFLAGVTAVGNGATTFGTGDCAKCHGYPPMTAVHAGKAATACITCHPHVNATGTGFTNKTLHINGTVDAAGGSCTGCHATTVGSGATPTRVNIMLQFTSSKNSHHVQGVPVTDTVCYACHWEADSAGAVVTAYHKSQTAGFKNKVQLVNWSSATTRPTVYGPTTYILYSSGRQKNSTRAQIAKINSHCLGCHNERNKAVTNMFGDGRTPSTYSWEALATTKGGLGTTAQSIRAKYSDTTTTLWGKFTGNFTNAKDSQTKALSAHGNAVVNQRGWSTLAENAQGAAVANYPNTSGSVNNVLCFDCHNSHGSATPGGTSDAITSSYSSATGRGKGAILKSTTAKFGGYSMAYRSYTGGSATTKNLYNAGAALCFDCHNNAAVGTPTGSAGNTTPWGYQTTFGGSAKIHGYADNPYFGKAGLPFAKAITYTYQSPLSTNRGGHFGASSPLTTATTNNLQIGGLCTPCHDPHGVSPGILAANRQYAVPLLKETFVTSPYKQDAAAAIATARGGSAAGSLTQAAVAGYHIDQNTMQTATPAATTGSRWAFATAASSLNTLTDTQFAGLCIKCHAKTVLNNTAAATAANWKSMNRIHNSVKGWASTGGANVGNVIHAYTCSKCHSPHNSNLPRLLVTNCLDAGHKGRIATRVPPTAALTGPFSGSNGSGNGLGRFPGGGSYNASGQRATNPGPWFFGTAGSAASPACHDRATSGGTTDLTGAAQLWNTKSPTW